ncbi:MAG: hypothetical protein KDE57_17635, partial [Calditrichaeota bacterium]|nr:hypothetical protein [Calditrichota bacterium]
MAVLLLPVSLIAEEFWASTPSEISAALQQVQPGDTITMTNGIWTNAEILFKANGAEGDSILLRAETPGRVLLNGSSRLRIAGNYLIVSGCDRIRYAEPRRPLVGRPRRQPVPLHARPQQPELFAADDDELLRPERSHAL